MKLKEGKHTKKLAPLYRKKLQTEKKIKKKFKALDSKINNNKALRLGRSFGRGVYRLTSKANNIVFRAGMGFAIAGAMGEDEVATGSAIYQGFQGAKENMAKERTYKDGAHKHKIARAYQCGSHRNCLCDCNNNASSSTINQLDDYTDHHTAHTCDTSVYP